MVSSCSSPQAPPSSSPLGGLVYRRCCDDRWISPSVGDANPPKVGRLLGAGGPSHPNVGGLPPFCGGFNQSLEQPDVAAEHPAHRRAQEPHAHPPDEAPWGDEGLPPPEPGSSRGWPAVHEARALHPPEVLDLEPSRRLPAADAHRVDGGDPGDADLRPRLHADSLPVRGDDLELGRLAHPGVEMLPVDEAPPDGLRRCRDLHRRLDHDWTPHRPTVAAGRSYPGAMAMKVFEQLVVGALQCNCYLVGDPLTRKAIVIDPGDEADAILAAADRHGLQLV